MSVRVLPASEWDRLPETPHIAYAVPPQDSRLVVLEENGEIVGTLFVARVTHFENLWLSPSKRGNAKAAMELVEEAYRQARSFGSTWAWGASDTDKASAIIKRVGGKELAVKTFIIPIGGN